MVKLTQASMYPASPMMDDQRGPTAYLPIAILEGMLVKPGAAFTFEFKGKVKSVNEQEVCVELQEGEMEPLDEEATEKK